MKKVITYGTYDLLHYGHIRLLERAKALGDHLIVGITSDAFDRSRGKINVQQSLVERIEAVKSTGIADEIVVEEYEGQKIDDIKRLGVDVFTVGSDWVGKFDYLKEYCEVVYLDRTEGISSSDIRTSTREIRVGLIGNTRLLDKYAAESRFVNGASITGVCAGNRAALSPQLASLPCITDRMDELLSRVDAVFVLNHPSEHARDIRIALAAGKHVLCESPIALRRDECEELYALAEEKGLILYDAIRTAYATAFERLLLLAKGGKIGDVVSVSATCTSLFETTIPSEELHYAPWSSMCAWGPTAMLPIFQLLGVDYRSKSIITKLLDEEKSFDSFSKLDFLYDHTIGSALVGKRIKSEGEMVISGTRGYIYVPAPWWKTDYFEIRYENQTDNKRYFYQLDGDGIRNEIVSFVRSINVGRSGSAVSRGVSLAITDVIQDFTERRHTCVL